MDRVNVRNLGGADHGGNIEVTLRKLRRADTNCFVGKTDVQRVAVCLAIDCDRLDAEFLARTDDAQGNLTSIGYQYLLEHVLKDLSCQLSAIRQPDGTQSSGITDS